MNARLVFLNVGRPKPLEHAGSAVMSSIDKKPATGALELGLEGLMGDEQGDKKNHGGPDKAVCVYALEHYAYWQERLGCALGGAAFGENFSTEGLLEDAVCLGDVYAVGTATLQVSQPRQPCYKLAAKHGAPQLVQWVQEAGMTGFYLRCLEPGTVQAGDAIRLLERPELGVSVAEMNRLLYRDPRDTALLRRVLAQPALADPLRLKLEAQLA